MLKNRLQMGEVLFEGAIKHYDIVQIHQAVRPLQAGQYQVHEALEGCRGIAKPKWHHTKLKEALRSAEGSLRAIVIFYFHLPVPA